MVTATSFLYVTLLHILLHIPSMKAPGFQTKKPTYIYQGCRITNPLFDIVKGQGHSDIILYAKFRHDLMQNMKVIDFVVQGLGHKLTSF